MIDTILETLKPGEHIEYHGVTIRRDDESPGVLGLSYITSSARGKGKLVTEPVIIVIYESYKIYGTSKYIYGKMEAGSHYWGDVRNPTNIANMFLVAAEIQEYLIQKGNQND